MFLYFYILFSYFPFKFISPAYKHTSIAVNHIICNIRCLNKLVKGYCSYLDLIFSILFFFFFFFKCKTIEFREKCEKNTLNRWGMLMQVILVKLTVQKCKAKITMISCPGINSLKLKTPPKKSNNILPVPAASTAGPCPSTIGRIAVLQQFIINQFIVYT